MMQRHDMTHRADADALRARGRRDGVQVRRGHPALVGREVMLDRKSVVETDLIRKHELAPQLLVALVRRHTLLAPNVRKMRELHERRSSALQGNARRLAKKCIQYNHELRAGSTLHSKEFRP